MKLRSAFSPLEDLTYAIRVAFVPTIREVIRAPLLLLHPSQLSRLFMHYVWGFFGNVINENLREIKGTLITPHAHGAVLDIGAGSSKSCLTIVTTDPLLFRIWTLCALP
jgi:hypothetical protein